MHRHHEVMSRIAPLEPPYEPEIAGAVRPHHAWRAAADAVSRHRLQCARLGEIPRRQPARPRSAHLAGARNRHRPHLRADRMRVRMGCACRHLCGRGASSTEAQVRATVLDNADAPCWSPAEQALIAAVDALHAPRHAQRSANSRRCRRITTMRRSSKSSCSAASIAPCRISRTGSICRWRKKQRGFRLSRHCERSEAIQKAKQEVRLLRRFRSSQ